MPFHLWVAGWTLLFLVAVVRPRKITQVPATLLAMLLITWSACGLFYII